MRRKQTAFGQTGLEVTLLSFGCGPFGDMWAPVPDDQAAAAVEAAFGAGIRYFDVAPLYGSGKAERRLGLGLAGLPREEFTVSTKVGRLVINEGDPPVIDYSPDGVRRSLETSLERTGLDRFDIVHVHDPERHVEEALDGAFPTLRALQAEGAIGAVSCGTNFSEPLTRFVAEGVVDCVLLASRFTLLDHSALDDLLPLALERGIPVIAASVFNSGVLADPDADPSFVNYFYRPATPEIIERARAIREICLSHGVSLRAAALQFPLTHPAVASVLVGCRSAAEVVANVADFEADIPAALWGDLADAGFLSGQAVPAEP
jgi:D-threo-aldose 1-dehydrogenase